MIEELDPETAFIQALQEQMDWFCEKHLESMHRSYEAYCSFCRGQGTQPDSWEEFIAPDED